MHKTPIYANRNMRNHPNVDINLGSLETPLPETGKFLKLMLLYPQNVTRVILRQKDNGTLRGVEF